MRIKSVRIENFRSFSDQTIHLNRYTCLVGANGAGKSNVLTAVNAFFRQPSTSVPDPSRLVHEDYFLRRTSNPARITVTFQDLGQQAEEALKDYARRGELAVTAEARYEEGAGYGAVRYYGQRSGMDELREYFEADKDGAKAPQLTAIFERLRQRFPDIRTARSKEDRAAALREYEASRPEGCVLIPSEDNFYGVNGTGKLAPFVQWVYVPAVKDASEEGQESRNTALGRLIARAVRTRTAFDAELNTLRSETLTRYQELLERNREGLAALAKALQGRLESWAHPNVRFDMEWLSDPVKAVVVQQPVAGIKTGERDFLGSLERMGHGLQRSYLLALLQELANSDTPEAPTLVLGCEEPELYQHPPQARHLAEVLTTLSEGNNQVLVTTHSPLFVSGDGFEDARIVRNDRATLGSSVKAVSFAKLCERVREVLGEDVHRPLQGRIAKIHQALQPGISELFFARVPILVEGLEDVAYLTTQLQLSGRWPEFRRLGCHFVPTHGKDKLILPVAIATELGLPIFVVFDADGDTTKQDNRARHEKDNRALFSLLGSPEPPFPAAHVWAESHVVWQSSLTQAVREELGASYEPITEAARLRYAHEPALEKNAMFIADWLSDAYDAGVSAACLDQVCDTILAFATKVH